jgi:Tfp pilus assembly protein PilX
MVLLYNSLLVTIKNQEGSTFLMAMLLLMLLTLMGTFALMTTNIEIQIAANEKDYLREFYVTDSAWKEITPWLNRHGIPPSKINTSLEDNVVKNFGNGGNGILNDSFPHGTEDGELSGIPYWNKVEYVSDTKAAGSGKGYRRFNYRVKSNAGRRQEIEVTLSKVYKVGY